MKKRSKITVALAFLFILMTGFVYGQDRAISSSQLPKKAKTFLSSYFKGIQIGSVIEDREIYGVDEYKVYLTNGVKVEFDRSGNWKEVDGEQQKIPVGFISANIRNHVARSFPNTYITQISKESWSYDVELSNGLDLEFDRNGNFTKIDD